MSTGGNFTSVKNQINKLINNANTKTGNNDIDLTTAVDHLISGYGTGEAVLENLEVAENGTYTPGEGVDGFGSVTVDVAGSGGGSLPAGVYWEQIALTAPYNYSKTYFVYNGSLCLACNTVSSGSSVNIYKLVDGAWSLMASSTKFYAGLGKRVLEYNGKVHFFQGSYHEIWDGASILTHAANMPSSNDNTAQFVLDDNLYSWDYSTGIPYVWDEATDTWSEADGFTSPGTSMYGSFIVQNGNDIYLIYSGIYKLQDDKSWLKISTVAPDANAICENGYLYWIKYVYKSPSTVYRMNLETLLQETVGYGLASITHTLYYYDEKIRVYFNGSGLYSIHLIMHEVTE